ncbi:MAG: hypothetical protein JKY52_01060 [Flavobacteriales bacterium]|nr:hypothetical protein [Flavobacteriales bacterium]
MQKRIILTGIALLAVSAIFAQKVKVENTSKSIGGGKNDAFVTVIYNSKESDVKKEWKALLKQYAPEKVKSGGEIMADNATISGISSNTIDIYAKVKQAGNDVELTVGFDLGGAFVDASHSGAKTAENIVYEFAVKIATAAIEREVKAAEKLLVLKEKELEKLVKSNDRLHQNIEKFKAEIETANANIKQAESDLETNTKDQEGAKKGIEDQQTAVKLVGDKLKEVR